MFIINYIFYRYCFCSFIQIRSDKGRCCQYILPFYRGCSTWLRWGKLKTFST